MAWAGGRGSCWGPGSGAGDRAGYAAELWVGDLVRAENIGRRGLPRTASRRTATKEDDGESAKDEEDGRRERL